MMVGTTRRQSDTIWSKILHAKAIYDIEEPKYISEKGNITEFQSS